jgi:hypothetical protein
MHDISRVPVNSALTCTTCGLKFPLDRIEAALNTILGSGSSVRDITCCTKGGHSNGVVVLNAAMATNPLWANAEKPSKPEPTPVCRWCKGTREITVNFKTKRCEECANENGTIGPEGVGVGWKVKKTFCVDA